jgi:hypothetical protein
MPSKPPAILPNNHAKQAAFAALVYLINDRFPYPKKCPMNNDVFL